MCFIITLSTPDINNFTQVNRIDHIYFSDKECIKVGESFINELDP